MSSSWETSWESFGAAFFSPATNFFIGWSDSSTYAGQEFGYTGMELGKALNHVIGTNQDVFGWGIVAAAILMGGFTLYKVAPLL